MKRALAERAKQSGGGAGLAAPAADETSSSSPPLKVPRLQEPSAATLSADHGVSNGTSAAAPLSDAALEAAPPSSSSSTSVHRSSTASPKPTTMKRQRSSQAITTTSVEANDSSTEEQSTFYLKHQNKALASELKNLQYQLKLLEKERDARRQQCRQAIDALHALNTSWTHVEVSLGGTLEGGESTLPSVTTGTMRSTGTGDSVELVGVLRNSLAALAKNHVTLAPSTTTDELSHIVDAISNRVTALQDSIQNALKNAPESNGGDSKTRLVELEGQVRSLQSRLQDADTRIAELAATKDEAVESDRRVRRGLYRLAAGRMQLPEVLKAIELDDSGMAAMEAEEAEAAIAEPTPRATVGDEQEEGAESVDAAQVAQVKKQLQDAEAIASSRESQITELNHERESLLKRVNDLLLAKSQSTDSKKVSEQDIRRSPLYTETATKLTTVTRQFDELQAKLKETLEKYAEVKADADLAKKTLEERLDEFQQRWAELTGGEGEENGNQAATGESPDVPSADPKGQSKRIIELEHKLKQALENVRQADTVRSSLEEAHQMNDFLQGKLEELKTKNAALVASKTAARSSSDLASLNDAPKDKEKPSTSHTPVSSEKAEKLAKEHRRMKKELAAAMQSKENAKEKQMRAEKERDTLMKTNSRLLKQGIEKEDMNAKSLSTILHLKHLTEQLTTEKGLLEQQVKSAEQLALAARLATNAKERVTEELAKEKDSLQDKVKELEEQCNSLQKARETAEGNLSRTKAEMEELKQSASHAKSRCDELAAESTKQEEEKRKLLESLAVAQREATEASSKIGELRKSQGATGGGSTYSGFTHDELVQVIKGFKKRVTCGVCNERDKKVMITRCKHFFCKECVDENIKNRSRKCPACGQRFDTKDVEDIFLD